MLLVTSRIHWHLRKSSLWGNFQGRRRPEGYWDVRSCITSNEGGWDEGTNLVSSAMIKEDKRVEIGEVNPTIIQANDRLPNKNGGMQQH